MALLERSPALPALVVAQRAAADATVGRFAEVIRELECEPHRNTSEEFKGWTGQSHPSRNRKRPEMAISERPIRNIVM